MLTIQNIRAYPKNTLLTTTKSAIEADKDGLLHVGSALCACYEFINFIDFISSLDHANCSASHSHSSDRDNISFSDPGKVDGKP